MAARLREELGIEVELKDGPFGRADVIVNGKTVATSGLSGWLPRTRVVIERVKASLSPGEHGPQLNSEVQQ